MQRCIRGCTGTCTVREGATVMRRKNGRIVSCTDVLLKYHRPLQSLLRVYAHRMGMLHARARRPRTVRVV